MATSRDDFVIAIRSAFLKRANKQRFSLIGLIFFSIGLIIFSKINLPFTNYLNIGLNEIVYRSSFIVSFPEKKIYQFSTSIKEHYNLYNDYNKIKNELRQLKSEKLEFIFLKEDSSLVISISAGTSSRHLVLSSKPPILTLQRLIFSSLRVTLKVLGMARSTFKRSVFLSFGRKKK